MRVIRPSLQDLVCRSCSLWRIGGEGELALGSGWGEGADHARPCPARAPALQPPPPSCILVHQPWDLQPQQQWCAAGAASFLFGPSCAPPEIGAAQKANRGPPASQEHGAVSTEAFGRRMACRIKGLGFRVSA